MHVIFCAQKLLCNARCANRVMHTQCVTRVVQTVLCTHSTKTFSRTTVTTVPRNVNSRALRCVAQMTNWPNGDEATQARTHSSAAGDQQGLWFVPLPPLIVVVNECVSPPAALAAA